MTFETDDEAKRVLRDGDNLVLKGRKLNVAIAIKKQQVGRGVTIGELCAQQNQQIPTARSDRRCV